MPDMPVKMIYTTGAVTQMNYLQKKLGIKAEHHHRYAFLIAEVDSTGNWWVRQVSARKSGKVIQDLNVLVEDGAVTSTEAKAEAITWGDLHATIGKSRGCGFRHGNARRIASKVSNHPRRTGRRIRKSTSTQVQSLSRKVHRVAERFASSRRGIGQTKSVLERYLRPWCKTVVPDANHDRAWLKRWLREYDYKVDPPNTELFLRMQSFMYGELRAGKLAKNINLIKFALEKEAGLKPGAVKFLLPDESFTVDEVELGMHGHLGPNGAFGSPSDLAKIGKKATTAHTHSASIIHGLYVAGTSTVLTKDWDYTVGPSSWSWSHVVQYGNGQRAIVTLKNGKWRA